MKLLRALLFLLFTAIGVSAAPDIVVEGSDGISWPNIDDGDLSANQVVTDFDTVQLGNFRERTYRVRNTGNDTLTITALPTSSNAQFTISGLPNGTNIGAGNENQFTIRFTPTSRGNKTATITIRSNDPDAEDPYTFAIEGVAEGPEITMSGSDDGTDPYSAITDGDTTPTLGQGTDFGTIAAGSTRDRFFRIKNDGDSGLTYNNPTITGPNAGAFEVRNLSTIDRTISAGNSREFEIRFSPDTAGTKTATFSMTSNDEDESPYTFNLTATATGDPNILVQGQDTGIWNDIVDGDLTPNQAVTNFGTVEMGQSNTRTFRVKNEGRDVLNITARSSSNAMFTISGLPAGTNVPANDGINEFTITFTPTSRGTKTATITIENNDPDGEGTYTFAIEGLAEGPEITMSGSDDGTDPYTGITDGDTTPTLGQGTDFGTVAVGNDRERFFRIKNDGDSGLNYENPVITGPNAGAFEVISLSTIDRAIAPGNSREFKIRFTPTTGGTKTATFSISSDDLDESPYTFALTGVATVTPDILIQGSDNLGIWSDINDGDLTPNQVVTDFGNVDLNTFGERTYRIKNEGTGTLTISSRASNNAQFTISGLPAGTAVPAGATNEFTIRFTPTATGTQNATITVTSDDPDAEATYTFAITGFGRAPEITMSGSTAQNGTYTPITDGETTPTTAEGTDFGTVAVGNSRDRFFRINNSGTNGLNISAPTFTGAGAAHFSVRSLDTLTNIGQGNTREFVIRFEPTTSGTKTATFSMANSDPNEDPYNFTVTGVATVTPDILVQGSDSVGLWSDINDGDLNPDQVVTDFDNVDLGFFRERTYRIKNEGTGPLTISSRTSSNAQFTISGLPAGTIVPAGGINEFTVRFTPTARNTSQTTITILSDDPDSEATYTFALTGTGEGPEMQLEGRGDDSVFRNIADGTTSTSTTTGTDFGNVNVTGTNAQRTFRITNNGDKALNLTGRSFSGPAAAEYDVSNLLILGTRIINPGNSIEFTVTFDPTTSGTRNATLTINNNDGDEDPYSFALTGNGIGAPEIRIQGNPPLFPRLEIADGDNTPRNGDGTLFNDTDAGQTKTYNFRIHNDGDGRLTFSTPTLTGDNPGAFQILGFTTAALDPGQTKDFDIRFAPTNSGLKTAVFSLGNNDGNENPYNFTIQGTCIAPEISIQGGAAFAEDIADGDITPRDADGTTFGFVGVSNQSASRSFRIRNTGTRSLSSVSASTNNAQFTVSTPPNTSVLIGQFTDFVVTFDPSSTGTKTATVTVMSDDPNETTYTFKVEGEGLDSNPAMRVTGDNNTAFTNGQTAVNLANGTDFGSTDVTAGTIVKTYHIENTGTGVLNISSITSNNARFTVGSLSATAVNPGQSMDFPVTFDPSAVSTVTATLTINSNVTATPAFTFRVSGTGINTPPPAAPELDLFGGDNLDVAIVNGDGSPRTRDGTDFQEAEAGNLVQKTFRIRNTGNATLNITSTSATGTGSVTGLAASIPAGGQDDFLVGINRQTPGTANVVLTISSNDPNEAPYTFTVTVNAVAPASVLALTDFSVAGTDASLTFTSVAGRTYRVASSPALGTGTWTPMPGFTGIAGDSAAQTLVLPNAIDPLTGPRLFYRLEEE